MKIIAAVAVLLAQTQTVPLSEVIDVRLHNVDVIVTDAKGNHVPGLRIEDFELLENGTPQEITNFAEYSDSASAVSSSSEPPTPGLQPLTPQPRKFVLFIDEMNLHPTTRAKFAGSVGEMFNRALRDGDEAMVVRPAEAEKLALEFTSDRAAIRAAIAKAMQASVFRANSPKETEDRLFEREIEGSGGSALQVARRYATRAERRVAQRLANLRAVVAALAESPGRKIIVMVTESIPAQPGREFFIRLPSRLEAATFDAPADHLRADYLDLSPVITEIARIASSKGITIYCLQPEYARLSAPGSVETKHDRPGYGGYDTLRVFDQLDNSEQTMKALTETTGGKWFRGDTRVDDAFRQVTLDVQSYYSLAYHGVGAVDEPRKLAVRVKNHPELHVRTRGEVIRKSPRRELSDRVVASLLYPPSHNALGIAARVSGTDLDVLVPIGNLTFTQDRGVHRASFTVHYAIFGERTDFVSGVEPEQVVEIPDAKWESARLQPWTHTLHFNVRKGPHRLAVGVLDSTSQEWGIDAVTLSR